MNSPWRTMTGDERLGSVAGYWRMAVPVLGTLVAIMLMSAPLFSAIPVVPHLAMLSVMIWSLWQPQLMPAWLALPLGIATDAALGLPMGINATMLPILALGIGISEQRAGQQLFLVEWGAATLVIVAYQLLTGILLSFVLAEAVAGPMFIQAVSTALAYPVMLRMIARLQRGWVMG